MKSCNARGVTRRRMARARVEARGSRRRGVETASSRDVDDDGAVRATRARRRAVVERDTPPAVTKKKTTKAKTRSGTSKKPPSVTTRQRATTSTTRVRWWRSQTARRLAVVVCLVASLARLGGVFETSREDAADDAFASARPRRGLGDARARALRDALRAVAAPWASEAIDFFIDDVARTPTSTKAPTVLLAARTTEAMLEVRARLEESFASDPCALTIECASTRLREMDVDEARGELQRALTRHFRRCADAEEGATVVLHDVADMVPAHVPALLPALSEHGVYVRDGESVRASHAAFVLTARLPALDVSPRANEKTFTNAAKRALLRAMRKREDVDDEDATSLAFRRRVDVAVEV